jgi:hypothetical protein
MTFLLKKLKRGQITAATLYSMLCGYLFLPYTQGMGILPYIFYDSLYKLETDGIRISQWCLGKFTDDIKH